jgi:hypothetical protein
LRAIARTWLGTLPCLRGHGDADRAENKRYEEHDIGNREGMGYPLGQDSGGQRANSETSDVDGRRGELCPTTVHFRSANCAQLCHVGGCCRQHGPDRDSVDQSRHEQSSQALRSEEHEGTDDREAKRREDETPAPIPVGKMTCEQQRANDADRVNP